MTSPTEEEIVARAIEQIPVDQDDGAFGPLTEEDCAKLAKIAIHALDQYRAKNAGEVEFQPWCPSCRATSANDKRCGVCATETVFQARDVSRAITLITSLRSIIGEKDEALRRLASNEAFDIATADVPLELQMRMQFAERHISPPQPKE